MGSYNLDQLPLRTVKNSSNYFNNANSVQSQSLSSDEINFDMILKFHREQQ